MVINQPLVVQRPKQPVDTGLASDPNPEFRDAMLWVWAKFGEIWGGSFINQYGDVDGAAFNTWCDMLSHLTPKHLYNGFCEMRKAAPRYVPSLFEFQKYCESPEGCGAPGYDDAWDEAKTHGHEWESHDWSHPAVLEAVRDMGRKSFKYDSHAYCRRKFRMSYKKQIRKVVHGIFVVTPRPIPPPKVPSGEPLSGPELRRRIRQAKAELGFR